MTQETVIHGGSGGTSKVARCGTENPETVTVNLALMTCSGCIVEAQEQMLERLRQLRHQVAGVGIAMGELAHKDESPAAITTAIAGLDYELDALRRRLENDTTAAQAAADASDV